MNNDEEQEEGNDEQEIEVLVQELVQCSACLRRMRPEIFSKHPNVCKENPTRKRQTRIFDMTKYRSIKSGDRIIPVPKISSVETTKTNSRPSETRSAKRDRRADTTVVPPVISSFTCPTCKRTFCEKAYERHATFCSSKLKQQQLAQKPIDTRLKLDRRTNEKPLCFVSMRRNHSDSLARCPWCSKPYLPNCIHYCRNSNDLFSIQSK